MGAPGIQPLGIQQAMMCIACLQQPVPMKYAGVYDNICQCQLFVSSFWRPIRKLCCAHGTALKVIVNECGMIASRMLRSAIVAWTRHHEKHSDDIYNISQAHRSNCDGPD